MSHQSQETLGREVANDRDLDSVPATNADRPLPAEVARRQRGHRSPLRRSVKHLRRQAMAQVAVLLVFAIGRLPRRLTAVTADVMGFLAWHLLRSERRRAIAQISVAMGESTTHEERRAIARGVFRHFTYIILENLVFGRWGYRRIHRDVEFRDWDRLTKVVDELHERDRGVIVIAPHLGNWELIGSLGCRIWGNAVCVGKRYRVPAYDRLVYRNRQRMGVDTMYSDEAFLKGIRLLKRRGLLGLLPDLDARRHPGLFVPFFGMPAYTSEGPAKLALRLGTPLLPIACVAEGSAYRFIWERPIFPEDYADSEDPVEALTRDWLAGIERLIRRYPDQWVWMHKRWNSTPDSIARRHLARGTQAG